jgi:hypothetical protein
VSSSSSSISTWIGLLCPYISNNALLVCITHVHTTVFLILPTSLVVLLLSIFLPVVLYGWETWSLTLREEHRLRVFENRVLRRIFGSKRDEVAGGWRKLHNEELHDLYSSPSIIRMIKSKRMRWVGHLACMG